MQISRGTWIVSAAPVTICLGPWLALASLGALLLASAATTWIFTRAEKEQLAAIVRNYLDRAQVLVGTLESQRQ